MGFSLSQGDSEMSRCPPAWFPPAHTMASGRRTVTAKKMLHCIAEEERNGMGWLSKDLPTEKDHNETARFANGRSPTVAGRWGTVRIVTWSFHKETQKDPETQGTTNLRKHSY